MKKTKLVNYIFILSAIIISLSGCSSFTDGKGLGVNYDRRTAGTILDDQGLSMRADTILAKDKELWQSKCHINTLSYNNSILLVGQAPTDELKERAATLLHRFVPQDQIYNQITVENPTSLTARAKDTWITTQVKGKILANKNIGVNRVKIVTENGIVFLMGILTKDEENIVTDLASQTSGVKQVIKIITEHDNN